MNSSYERAQQLSRRMQTALAAIALIVVCAAAYAAIRAMTDTEWLGAVFREKYGNHGPVALSKTQAFGLVLLFLAQVGLLLAALHALWRALGTIAASDHISLDTALWIRRAGFAFAVTCAAMVLSNPLNSLIGSIGAMPGRRFISIAFDSQQMLTFLLAAVLIILGHILVLAADLADDNRRIV
jgi:hypothetical protein